MLLRIFLLILLPLSLCSCRVFLPSLEKFALESSYFRIHSKVSYDGLLVLGDSPDKGHGKYMHRVLTEVKGIPEENIVFMPEFLHSTSISSRYDEYRSKGLYLLLFSDEYSHILSQARVVSLPVDIGLLGNMRDQISWIEGSDILFVFALGNASQLNPYKGDLDDGSRPREFWYPDNPAWSWPFFDYDLYKDVLATDHVIVASALHFRWDAQDEYGENIVFSPGDVNVKCGDLKENCFSVAGDMSLLKNPSNNEIPYYYSHSFTTSGATAVLSAISFYLSQFYSTPEEIVSVLRSCAIDVGPPGVDEEYGVGLVNLFCPEVFEKEAAAAVNSSEVSEESHTLTALTQPLPETFSLFSSVGLTFQGMQGYAGVSYATQSLQMVALAGFGNSSLGIYSDLYHERSMFFELGVRKPLTPFLSFIGTYGRQYGNLSVDSVRAGLHAVKQVGRMQASAYVGRHMFRCSLGLPGYQMAGARKVSFSRGAWEARFSLSFSL